MLISPVAHAAPLDWSGFLQRQDPTWQRLPQNWQDALYVGDGTQGLMVFQTGPRTLQLLIGNSYVQDHRAGTASFERARLPVGWFEIETVGELGACDLRVDLWNAEIRGTIQTSRGALDIRALALARQKALWVQTTTSGDEGGYQLKFVPGKADSMRTDPKYKRPIPKSYTSNPAPVVEREGNIEICVQPLQNAQTATAWNETTVGQTRTLFWSIAHSYPGTGARSAAVSTVRQCLAAKPDEMLNAHRSWWHAYYPASFVTLPDAYWQSFYYIQIYKMASASRADGPYMDNHGPWLADTPWPYATWNLNVQLAYWPFATSNRVSEGLSLINTLTRNRDALIHNVPAQYRADSAAISRAATQDLIADTKAPPAVEELNDLTWALDDVWQMYRATMDDQLLRDELYPILRRSINYDLHFLAKGEDGKLHFPNAFSPEYGDAPDANYNLALIRWGCHVLLASSERLKIDDPLRPKWREVLADLTPYPSDENGFLIGRGVPLVKPHRHFSHLLMIYPLHLLDPDVPADRADIEKSLDWWMKHQQAIGYQFVGASAMAATLGQGDLAFEYFDQLRRFLRAGTMYPEAGPVIETPLAGAQALHEMMLQSAGVWKTESMPTPVIRVFPAMPTVWKDAAFQDLRAQGAFLVSAVRKDGVTQWIRIRSEAGEKAFLRAGMITPQIKGDGLKLVKDDLYEVTLKKGQSVELLAKGLKVAPTVEPVGNTQANPFGLKLEAPKPPATPAAALKQEPTAMADAQGVFNLTAQQAHLHGQRIHLQVLDNQANICARNLASEWVSWGGIKIERAAKYRVSAQIASIRPSEFAVSIGGKTLAAEVPVTGSWTKFQTFDFGEIEIGKLGTYDLEVRPGVTGWFPVNVRNLKLTPIAN